MGEKNLKELMKVALGQDKADMVVVNARLVNVYTGEILEEQSICIKDQWISYVGKDAKDCLGEKTLIIDAAGKTVIPGLIDGHTHMALFYTACEFLEYAMRGGTTTIITETLEPYPVCGYEGLVDFLDSLQEQPIKIYATAPAMVSISRAARGIPRGILKKILKRPDIVGMGESYWQAVLQDPDQYLLQFRETLRAGKTLEGHSAGASGKKLVAYAAAGISSCHEPIKADEVLDRLRLGLHVMVREGSIRRDLEEISKIKDYGVDLRRLILATDSVGPEDLIAKGYMEFVVQKAIDCGFDPIMAVQMATLNVAEHFSLDHLIGGIAPGRYADLVIIPDETTIKAEVVISNGKVIAREGRLLEHPRAHHFQEKSLNSIHLPRDIKASDFIIGVKQHRAKITLRVMDMITDLVSREMPLELPVGAGEIRADTKLDILKIAAIDRTNHPGKTCVGLIKGFHMSAGAIACSAAWDTSDIIVVGVDDEDMAMAVNWIKKNQGGAVICVHGKIMADLPLPIFGLLSDLPIQEIVQRTRAITDAASELGVPFPDPLLTLITLTSAAIPYFRICEEGLVNLKDGKTVGLFMEG